MKKIFLSLILFCSVAYAVTQHEDIIFNKTISVVGGIKGALKFLDADFSNSVSIQSPDVVSSNVAFKLPGVDGGANQFLKTDGSGNLGWGSVSGSTGTNPGLSDNYSFTVAVGSGAATIALKQADGSSDCSGGSPCTFSFDDLDGTYSIISVSSSLDITIPSTATLGHTDAVEAPVFVYLINNSGAAELMVSSILYDEAGTQDTIAIDTASDDGNLYSTTARSTVPIRLIGMWLSTQTTAGTWASTTGDKVVNPKAIWDYISNLYYTASSAAFNTGTGGCVSNEFCSYTGNGVSLNPGVYKFETSGNFNDSSGTSTMFEVWITEANGDNTNSVPTAIGTATTVIDSDIADRLRIEFSSATILDDTIKSTSATLYVPTYMAIYCVSRVIYSVSGATVACKINARRIR